MGINTVIVVVVILQINEAGRAERGHRFKTCGSGNSTSRKGAGLNGLHCLCGLVD